MSTHVLLLSSLLLHLVVYILYSYVMKACVPVGAPESFNKPTKRTQLTTNQAELSSYRQGIGL